FLQVEQLLSREGNLEDRSAARERLVMSLGGKAPKGKNMNYKILKKERKEKKESDARKAAEMKALLRVNSTKKKIKVEVTIAVERFEVKVEFRQDATFSLSFHESQPFAISLLFSCS
ncbi:hypothetical protein GCK32_018310, partial [Trichostrongylus colubriformis]